MNPSMRSGNGYRLVSSGFNQATVILDITADERFCQDLEAAPEVRTIDSVIGKVVVFSHSTVGGFDNVRSVVEIRTHALLRRRRLSVTSTWQLKYMGQSLTGYKPDFRITVDDNFPSNKLVKLLREMAELDEVTVSRRSMRGNIQDIDITPQKRICLISSTPVEPMHKLIENAIRRSLD